MLGQLVAVHQVGVGVGVVVVSLEAKAGEETGFVTTAGGVVVGG